MEISIRKNQHEREEFIEWIRENYPDAIINEWEDRDDIDGGAISLNELWTAYCEDV